MFLRNRLVYIDTYIKRGAVIISDTALFLVARNKDTEKEKTAQIQGLSKVSEGGSCDMARELLTMKAYTMRYQRKRRRKG